MKVTWSKMQENKLTVLGDLTKNIGVTYFRFKTDVDGHRATNIYMCRRFSDARDRFINLNDGGWDLISLYANRPIEIIDSGQIIIDLD